MSISLCFFLFGVEHANDMIGILGAMGSYTRYECSNVLVDGAWKIWHRCLANRDRVRSLGMSASEAVVVAYLVFTDLKSNNLTWKHAYGELSMLIFQCSRLIKISPPLIVCPVIGTSTIPALTRSCTRLKISPSHPLAAKISMVTGSTSSCIVIVELYAA